MKYDMTRLAFADEERTETTNTFECATEIGSRFAMRRA